MSGLFGKGPKEVKAPSPLPPVAIPEVGEEVKDIARRRRPRGFEETFLTGELVPETGRKRFLG